jgi:signal transduction histidine kinase
LAVADMQGLMRNLAVAVDEDIPEALRFIHASLARMDGLISAILKLSRLGRETLHVTAINTPRLVEECVSQIRHRLDECGGEVSVQPSLPNIISDKAAVQQIFTNLLDNAVKYFATTRPGRIVVAGRVDGASAIFEVRDNGRGVEPRDRERIFELFRRSGPQDRPGEGIGLAHVRALVRRLGGEVGVVSDGATGTTFRFSLLRDLRALLNEEPDAGKATNDEGIPRGDDRHDRGR